MINENSEEPLVILGILVVVLGAVHSLTGSNQRSTALTERPRQRRRMKIPETIPCPRCEWKNPSENNFCGKCAAPLDATELKAREDRGKTRDEVQPY